MTQRADTADATSADPPAGRTSEILDRARSGDRAAQAELYDRYATDVMSVARRMLGSTSRAEDAVQDTFVEVIRSIDRFRNGADIGTWIHRIAINKCLSQLRSPWWSGRLDTDDTDAFGSHEPQAGLDAALEVGRLLDRLPAVTRAVVWLHDAEGLTHREIGGLMGQSESFSKSQLARAHRKLRVVLAEEPEREVAQLWVDTAKTI